MDILVVGIFGGFVLVCIYLSMILSSLNDIVAKLDHLRRATWKQHTFETEQTKKESNAVKKSIWGSAAKSD